MSKVDFKITTWETVEVPDNALEVVTEKLKSGEIKTSNELFDFLMEFEEEPTYFIIDGVETQLTPEENDGWATIEVYDEDEHSIWANGKT